MKNAVMKHENNLKTWTQEVNLLKVLVQSMTLEIVKSIMPKVQNKEKRKT